MSYKAYTVATNFGCSGVSEYGATSIPLVDRVTLPDASYYQFTYEATNGQNGNVTGRLASLTLPTGGTITYSYSGGTNGIVCADGSVPAMNRVSSDGTRTYTRTSTGTEAYTTLAQDERGNQTLYHFSVDAAGGYEATHQQIYQGTTGSGSLLQEVLTCYNGASGNCDGQTIGATITEADVTSSYNGGSKLLTKTTLESTGTAVTNIAYYSGSTLLENVATPYTITSNGIYELQSSTTTDGSGNFVAETAYGYDQSTPAATSGLPQHVSVSGARGNLTSTQTYTTSSPSSALTTTTAYWDTGQPASTTAPGSFTTNFGYDSTQTFTTSTTLPTPSSGVSLGTSATYDTASGALLSLTGMNGDKTTFNSYDSLLRPTSVTLPNGSNVTTRYYNPNDWVTQQVLNSSSNQLQTTQYNLDGYGRPNRVLEFNGQSSNSWYEEDACYDATGRLQFQPTPYAGGGIQSAIVCSGPGTSYTYDALGRATAIVTPDGTTTISHLNHAVETTDVNGIQKITQYDLLGRISNICEISASINSSTGAGQASGPNQNCGMDIAGSGYTTPFTWNLSGHSLNTNSGGQQRTFVTDAIRRTTSVTEPERGTTTYTASSTGLQVVRTRPTANQTNASATTSTTTQYDALGRVVSISYTDGTKTKNFQYDQPASGWAEAGEQYNMKGRLALAVRSTSAGTAGTLYSYNVDGTVSANYECTPTSCGNANLDKSVLYSYDLGDNLTAESDGAGDTFSYTRSSAGEITGITNSFSDANDPATIVAANSVLNGPTGPLSYNLGNGLTAVNGYDSMGRNNGRWACSGSSSLAAVTAARSTATLSRTAGARSSRSTTRCSASNPTSPTMPLIASALLPRLRAAP